MATLLVLGAGMMGSALCVPLIDRGHDVRLVGTHLDREIVDALKERGVHPKLGLGLPDGPTYHQVEELELAIKDVEAVVLGVSSAGVEWATHALAPLLREGQPILMVAKGLRLHEGTLRALPDALLAALPQELAATLHPVAVAGPCIAGELARRVETCIVFAGRDEEALGYWKRVARGPYYHVWTSTDLVGVEVCAALKNAYAMGIALGAGLHEARGGAAGSVAMHNYESAVFAQSIVEMARLCELAGGQRESVFGLAGVGDLDVTCNGGRTGRFGRFLGLGLGRAGAIDKMEGATLECLEILEVMRRAMGELELDGKLTPAELPLLRQLARIALDGAPVELPFDRFFA